MRKIIAWCLVLLAAGAIGAWLLGHRAADDAEAALLARPVYRVVKQYEPLLYAQLRERYTASRAGTMSAVDFTNFASGAISEAATRQLGKASDPAVNALIRDMLDNARTLARQPGDACFRYLFPQVSGPPDVARHLDPAAQSHTQDLLAEVIRSSHEAPVAAPVTHAVQEQMAEVINGVYAQFGSDTQMMAHTEDPRTDRTKVCAMTLSLYERVMNRPPAESAALVRAMTQAQ